MLRGMAASHVQYDWAPRSEKVMLSEDTNERLTRVGKGTPMGELMRRYWHPLAAAVELDERPTKESTAAR